MTTATTSATKTAQTVTLASLKPIEDRGPEDAAVEVDGKTYDPALHIGQCISGEDPKFTYTIPQGTNAFTTTVAMGDRSATDEESQAEFFVDGARAAAVSPTLGKPKKVQLDVSGARQLTVRSSAAKTGECGTDSGLVLLNAEFTTATPPGATKADGGPTEYVADMKQVADKCDTFYFHDSTGVDAIGGDTFYHSLIAGRDSLVKDKQGTCSFEYNLGRSATRLIATAGVGDKSATSFSCTISIFADDRQLSSTPLTFGKTSPVNVPLDNALRLKIVYSWGGPGEGDCVLGDARIEQKESN
ncbi:MAG: NPCBM/NEW2 domain-containing protein [Gordonia sp. (in: high G+C Gram-positive bacteria)]